MADDDTVGGPEAAAHLRLALFYLDETLARRAPRLLRGQREGGRQDMQPRIRARNWRRRVGGRGGGGGRAAPADGTLTSSIFSSMNLTIGLRVDALSTISRQSSAVVPCHWCPDGRPSCGSCACCPGCCCC